MRRSGTRLRFPLYPGAEKRRAIVNRPFGAVQKNRRYQRTN
jgi:hypothetical protein